MAALSLAACASTPSIDVAALQQRDAAYASVIRFADAPASIARGPLAGMPVLLKDNIETRDMPTTAGSLALASNAPGRDAPLVTRLREAGALILGKTNLSEWANIRSSAVSYTHLTLPTKRIV